MQGISSTAPWCNAKNVNGRHLEVTSIWWNDDFHSITLCQWSGWRLETIRNILLALKLGHSIRKCCNIIRGRALRQNDIKKSNQIQNCLTLMELEFNSRVSSTAVATLPEKEECETRTSTPDIWSHESECSSEGRNKRINDFGRNLV